MFRDIEPKLIKNHDARNAVSATVSVLKWSGAIFRATSSKVSVQKVFLCPFHFKTRLSGLSLASKRLGDIPQVPGIPPKVCQIHDARKAVTATLSVLKWTGAIFRPTSSKVSVQKVLLCPFHCKYRPSGVSLESPGLENIPQDPSNRPEVGQNYNGRRAVLATLSVLKWSWAIFCPRSWKMHVQKVFLCPFHCKTRPSGVSLKSPGLENILQVVGNRAEVDQYHDARNALSATLSVLKLSRAIFRQWSSKVSVQNVLLCPFHGKPKPSGVTLESAGLEISANFQDIEPNWFKITVRVRRSRLLFRS